MIAWKMLCAFVAFIALMLIPYALVALMLLIAVGLVIGAVFALVGAAVEHHRTH